MKGALQSHGTAAGAMRRAWLPAGMDRHWDGHWDRHWDRPWVRPAMRVISRLMLSALAIISLAAGGSWGYRRWEAGRFTQSTDNAYLRADAVVVAPKVAGYVAHVLVAANQQVTVGQALVAIDRGHFEAAYAAAMANVAGRKADIARTRAEVDRQRAVVAQAAAQVMLERRAASFADGEARRSEALSQTGAGTAQNRDATDAARDQARDRVAVAQAGLAIAQLQTGLLDAQIDQDAAALASAAAVARDAQIDLDATTLVATAAGRVGDKTVTDGAYVQAGTRLMSIMPTDDLYLEANFKETQVGAMHPGQKASIRVDALPGLDLAGTVESLSPGTGAEFALLPAENATGNFTKIVQRVPVRIHVDTTWEQREQLLAGLSAEVSVDTRRGP